MKDNENLIRLTLAMLILIASFTSGLKIGQNTKKEELEQHCTKEQLLKTIK